MEFKALENTILLTDSPDLTLKNRDISFVVKTKRAPIYDDLIDEAGENVVRYLERFNLMQNQNVILLCI